jgi:trehalose synthase
MADDMPANNDNSTLGLHRIEDYAPVIGREAVEPILTKDRRLCFARIGHVSSTLYGGGVERCRGDRRKCGWHPAAN